MESGLSVKVEDGDLSMVEGSAHDRFIRDWKNTENPVEVKGIYVRYLADVDTINQTFKVALGFDLHWPATEEDVKAFKKSPDTFVPQFVPNLEIPNAKEEIKEIRALENGNTYKIDKVGGEQKNFMRLLVYLTCLEALELESFPFDAQDLTVYVDVSFALVERAMLVPGVNSYTKDGEQGNTPVLVLNRQFCALAEFDCKRVVVEFASRSAIGAESLDEEAPRWSQLVIRFQCLRRHEGYMGRLVFLCFLLSMTTLSVFTLDPIEDLSERINFLTTLVLAIVAFQFIVSQYLPQVPYLTLIDKYTMMVFFATVVLLGVVSINGSRLLDGLSNEDRSTIDTVIFFAYFGFMVVFQVGFFAFCYYKRRKEVGRFYMGSQQLTKVNYNSKTDSPIRVTGKHVLKESKKTNNPNVNAFISFMGKAKKE